MSSRAVNTYLTKSYELLDFNYWHAVSAIGVTVLGVALGAIGYYALSHGLIKQPPVAQHLGMSGNIATSAVAGYLLLSGGLIVTLLCYIKRVDKKRIGATNHDLNTALANTIRPIDKQVRRLKIRKKFMSKLERTHLESEAPETDFPQPQARRYIIAALAMSTIALLGAGAYIGATHHQGNLPLNGAIAGAGWAVLSATSTLGLMLAYAKKKHKYAIMRGT